MQVFSTGYLSRILFSVIKESRNTYVLNFMKKGKGEGGRGKGKGEGEKVKTSPR